ncbi:NAD(P)H-dependent oxidoreductase subunit E [bacterium]|jgi:NADH-quinone oxidoreductase subunit E|nr:NAD(P)H-dependent oxidoreductase subunit E [bacterium]
MSAPLQAGIENCVGPENGEITSALEKQAEDLVARYPVSKRSAVLPLLHLWQETFGYIGPRGVEWIAQRLSLQEIQVLELVTFYPWFRQRPYGKFHFRVCRTLPCALGGSGKTFAALKKLLNLRDDAHEGALVSEDGRFSLEYSECLASCGTAPVVLCNDDFHEKVDEKKVAELVAACR